MRYAVIEAPSNLGLTPNGVERLGDVLLANGLAERIGASRAGRVEPLPFSGLRDPQAGGTLNADGIAAWSPRLADAVGAAIDDGSFPVVLGGDCSILLGSALALRRRGRYGLLFVDGHADFFQPEAEPKGEAASMDLALATGHGPEKLTNIEGRRPLHPGRRCRCLRLSRPRGSASNRAASRCRRTCSRSIIHRIHELGIEEAARRGDRAGHASRARWVLHPFRRRLPR